LPEVPKGRIAPPSKRFLPSLRSPQQAEHTREADRSWQKRFSPSFRSKLRPDERQIHPILVKVAVAAFSCCGTIIGWKRIVLPWAKDRESASDVRSNGLRPERGARATIMPADSFGLPVSTNAPFSPSVIAGTWSANRSDPSQRSEIPTRPGFFTLPALRSLIDRPTFSGGALHRFQSCFTYITRNAFHCEFRSLQTGRAARSGRAFEHAVRGNSPLNLVVFSPPTSTILIPIRSKPPLFCSATIKSAALVFFPP